MNTLSVFVGSSREGVEIARSIQDLLSDVSEVDVWDQGVFGLSLGTLESLVQVLNNYDFAVLVLSADDLSVSHGVEQNSARDNVLIELGLFIGKLGRERTFVLYQRDSNVKIPSDLAGVTLASFSPPSDLTRLAAALGPACTKIRNAIRAKGKAIEVDRLGQAFYEHDRQLKEQQERINQLVATSMSDSIFHHLAGIYMLHKYEYRQDEKIGKLFQREFYFLKHRGFIGPETLEFDERLNGKNIAELACPTEIGKIYIKLRKYDIPKDWLLADPKKRGNLKTDVARTLELKLPDEGALSSS
jgi:Predicted nucleotide-binding protein containing TIR-like domain